MQDTDEVHSFDDRGRLLDESPIQSLHHFGIKSSVYLVFLTKVCKILAFPVDCA